MDAELNNLVFFDLDGTLLNNRGNFFPESTLRAIDLLKSRGIPLILSTGRDMDTHYCVEYKNKIKPDAIIHHNGSKITIGDKLLFEHTMDYKLLREIFEYCDENGYCVGTSIGGEDFFVHPEKKLMADISYTNVIERHFKSYKEIFDRKLKVTALSYAGDLRQEKDIIEKRFPGIELYAFSKGKGADLVERGFSKAEGIKKLCAYYKVPIENTYSFGDSPNDIAMLLITGVGIAMGNAEPEVKKIADYVTASIDDDGIYKGLKHFNLI